MRMKPKTRKERAKSLLDSIRGHFIVSQALFLAIKSIEKRPFRHQEPSNVEDMQLLLDEIFPLYKELNEVSPLYAEEYAEEM